MTKQITEWNDELQLTLAGVEIETLTFMLKQAIREFFTKSGFWVEDTTRNIIADKDTYTVRTPANSEALYLIGVLVNGYPYHLSAGAYQGMVGRYSFVPDLGKVTIAPVPVADIESGLFLRTAYKPTLASTTVPDEAVTTWYDEILSGALARLMAMPKKPYSDPVVAAYHLRRFKRGIATARDVARRRYSFAESGFIYPQEWRRDSNRSQRI